MRRISIYKSITFVLFLFQALLGQLIKLPAFPVVEDFIADTLYITIPQDSVVSNFRSGLQVLDTRDFPGRVLDIQQTEKYHVIPVDQYIALNRSLADLFSECFIRDSIDFDGTLYIADLKMWYDDKPFLAKGRRLNAYTVLYDHDKKPVSDWLWEVSVNKIHKEKEADQIRRMVEKWLDLQSAAIQSQAFHPRLYPYLFRRQLLVWTDVIAFSDGYALNAHLTLDFPPDQEQKWVRGSPGVFYRKAAYHESIAIGGLDQQWYRRINDRWVVRLAATGRLGFNNFDNTRYSHLDFWNVLFLNVSSLVSLNYRPVYHKGVFVGIGLFNSFNILPEVVDRYEFGLNLTVGVILP